MSVKNQPVSITPRALEAATRHAIKEKTEGREACGFIVGHGEVGQRVIRLKNHHAAPDRNYKMADTAVLSVSEEMDRTGEEIVAHYHSHPTGQPIPSPGDLENREHGHAYVIIGFDDEQPRAKAYRLDLEAIGVPRATEVLIYLAEDGQPYTPKPPEVPWALTEGNKVRLGYIRQGHTERRTVVAIISRATPTTIHLTPSLRGRNIPQSLPVNRILSAEVLQESDVAKSLRMATVRQARRAAQLIQQGPGDDVAEIAAILAAAYPVRLGNVTLVEDEEPLPRTLPQAKPVVIG